MSDYKKTIKAAKRFDWKYRTRGNKIDIWENGTRITCQFNKAGKRIGIVVRDCD